MEFLDVRDCCGGQSYENAS